MRVKGQLSVRSLRHVTQYRMVGSTIHNKLHVRFKEIIMTEIYGVGFPSEIRNVLRPNKSRKFRRLSQLAPPFAAENA